MALKLTWKSPDKIFLFTTEKEAIKLKIEIIN